MFATAIRPWLLLAPVFLLPTAPTFASPSEPTPQAGEAAKSSAAADEQASAGQAGGEKASEEQAPGEKVPGEQASAEQAPAAPAEQAPAAPAEQAPASPAGQAPAEQAPAEQAPAEHTEASTHDEQADHNDHPEHADHGEHSAPGITAGIRGAAIGAMGGGHVSTHFGAGAFVGVNVKHMFEVELAAKYLSAEHGFQVPIEVLAKVPFHLTPSLAPYVGAGLLAIPIITDAETEIAAGATGAAGVDYWILPWAGLTGQVSFNLLLEHGEPVQEVEGQAGVVFGF